MGYQEVDGGVQAAHAVGVVLFDAEAGKCAEPVHQPDEVQGVQLEGIPQVGSRRQSRLPRCPRRI
jgi:hypothetical protein